MLLGSLETGGTKFVCAIGDENGKIIQKTQFPTMKPEKTMPDVIRWFQKYPVESLGVAGFGPLNLKIGTPDYGMITTTPKKEWRNYNIYRIMKESLHVPVGLDTDVNGSMLGEATFGQAQGIENAVYMTVGTGIGTGILLNGNPVHGMLHPESGCMNLTVRREDPLYAMYPDHTASLEELAAGPSLERRWKKKGPELSDRKEVWNLEAEYLAEACFTYICILSPEIIILGGGVMKQKQLFPLIRKKVRKRCVDKIDTKEIREIDQYIVSESLQGDQGILGGLKLAYDALKGEQHG